MAPKGSSSSSSPAPEPRRLDALRRAHEAPAGGPTPRVEDYVEVIYELIQEKGYARIVDISGHLSVSPPTATKMIQRLSETGLVLYERYRGIVLTEEGTRLAKEVRARHGTIVQFLKALGVDEGTAHRDTEGIEHHLDPATLDRMAAFVAFAESHPEWLKPFHEALRGRRGPLP